MNRDQKAAVIEQIAGEISGSEAVFAVDYRGLTVAQAADLRERLRATDTRFRVVKNSLSERAADRAGADALKPLLIGPTALALVRGDAALAAKALNDAARATNVLEFKGGLMDGTALSADDVRSIARLPSREVLTAQLVGTIAAPISGLVRTLNALIAGVAIQLQAIADQGLVGGSAPAAQAPADQPAIDQPPADQPPTDQPPTGEPPTGEPSTDQPPADQADAPVVAETPPAQTQSDQPQADSAGAAEPSEA